MTTLRRGDPRSYVPTHGGITPALGKTYLCGKCNTPRESLTGRWKHPVLGWCCAGCKPSWPGYAAAKAAFIAANPEATADAIEDAAKRQAARRGL